MRLKKWQNCRCHCIAVQISKGPHNFSWTEELHYLYLGLPVPLRACTITAEESKTARETEQCARHSDTQSSAKPRNAVRERFSALVFPMDPDTGRQYTDTLVPSHKAPCTTRQRKGQYNQQDLSYQKGFYLLGNTRIYFNVFLNHSQNMFCVKSCKDHSLEI